MNKKFIGFILASSLSAPFCVFATSDDYPAADFQPKVLYQDESVSSSANTGSKSSFDPDYPAANFQPKVLYVDATAANASSEASTGEKSSFDPNFPAANFEPKVIYP